MYSRVGALANRRGGRSIARHGLPFGVVKRFFLVFLICLAIARSLSAADVPDGPYESLVLHPDDDPAIDIAAWLLPAERPLGTLVLIHGYMHSRRQLLPLEWIRRDPGWNLLMIDLREHGESTTTFMPSTLGYDEVWDVKAAIDEAERRGLSKPYAIYGHSLGASTALCWAGRDRRIAGVLASSPFRNAWKAAEQTVAYRFSEDAAARLPSLSLISPWRHLLEQVDVPTAVSARTDLRIWILYGEHDVFPTADQEAILRASPSPASFKRLLQIPGDGHSRHWLWRGNQTVPGHDAFVRDFLQACRPLPPTVPIYRAWPWASAVVVGVVFVTLAAMVRMIRPMTVPPQCREDQRTGPA